MLEPLGRFFQNSKVYFRYSCSIIEIEPLEALPMVFKIPFRSLQKQLSKIINHREKHWIKTDIILFI